MTDASVVVGPAAWHFGWQRDDWDRLAGAVVAGHVVECGTQCTGGNYAFFQEVPGLEHPGFPIAEMHEDGSSVITKHDGTGGLVSVGTVTAQLLYEIDGRPTSIPTSWPVSTRFGLEQQGTDRVRISGVRGEPAPPTIKVCLNYLGGFRNQVTFVLTGLDIDQKAALVERTLRSALRRRPVRCVRNRPGPHRQARRGDQPAGLGPVEGDRQKPRRQASGSGLFRRRSSKWRWPAIPGSFARRRRRMPTRSASIGRPSCRPTWYGRSSSSKTGRAFPFRPHTPSRLSRHRERNLVEHTAAANRRKRFSGPTKPAPLGTLFGARSGDKGGNANVGVWARDDEGYAWLVAFLTVQRFRATDARSRRAWRSAATNCRT